MNRLAAKRPLLFAAGCLVPLGLYLWAGQTAKLLDSRLGATLAELASGLMALLLVGALGWWGRVGFGAPRWRSLWVIIPYLLYAAGGYRGVTTGLGMTIYFVLEALLVGFQEELWMRGLFLALLRPRFGAAGAVVLSSLLFGVLHMAHLFSGAAVGDVLLQVLVTLLFGLIYAGIRLRTGSIWVVIFLHALVDLFSFVGRSEGAGIEPMAPWVMLVMAVLIIAYGVALVWQVDRAPGVTSTAQVAVE